MVAPGMLTMYRRVLSHWHGSSYICFHDRDAVLPAARILGAHKENAEAEESRDSRQTRRCFVDHALG